jgi:hypothetical protein
LRRIWLSGALSLYGLLLGDVVRETSFDVFVPVNKRIYIHITYVCVHASGGIALEKPGKPGDASSGFRSQSLVYIYIYIYICTHKPWHSFKASRFISLIWALAVFTKYFEIHRTKDQCSHGRLFIVCRAYASVYLCTSTRVFH